MSKKSRDDDSITAPITRPLEADWRTGKMLSQLHGGNAATWNRRLKNLQAQLVTEKVAKLKGGVDETEALGIVSRDSLGKRRNPKNGVEALAASPATQQRLLARVPPFIEEGWQTANMLMLSVGGAAPTWERRFFDLSDELVQQRMKKEGMSEQDALAAVERDMVGERRAANGETVVAISPKAMKLLKKKLLPPMGKGWKTSNMLANADAGATETWERRLAELSQELTQKIAIEEDISPEEAIVTVERNFVGKRRARNGSPSWAVSPQGWLLLEKTVDPLLKEGWKTAGMMESDHGSDYRTWEKRMHAMETILTQDIARELKLPPEEAKEIVRHNLVGMYRAINGFSAIAASPQAQELMLMDLPQALGEGWETGNMMAESMRGRCTDWNARMMLLASTLAEDIRRQFKIPKTEAKSLVEAHLIGERLTSRKIPILAAGPDAKRLLSAQYFSPPIEEGWKTGVMMSSTHRGDSRKWIERMAELRQTLIQEIADKKTISPAAAEEIVEKEWIGKRGSRTSSATLAASPQAQERLLADYPMRPAPGASRREPARTR